jgi:CBS domain-containing protein
MRASDVMTSNVISVMSDMTVRDVARIFVDKGISGAPVIDTEGHVAGMFNEGDLLRRVEPGTDAHQRSSWLEFFSSTDDAKDYIKTHAPKIRDVMTVEVASVSEDSPLSKVASILETQRIKRVPVTRAGQLVGIVSRANLVQALASIPEEPAANVALSDGDIRAALMGELAGHKWAFAGRNIVVNDGVWGIFHSMEAVEAVRVAAESIPGVKRVEDHTEPYPVVPGI